MKSAPPLPSSSLARLVSARAQADIDFLDGKTSLRTRRGKKRVQAEQALIANYIRQSFFAFVEEACTAGYARNWTADEVRQSVAKELTRIAQEAFVEKYGEDERYSTSASKLEDYSDEYDDEYGSDDFGPDEIVRQIKHSDDWRHYLTRLRDIANKQALAEDHEALGTPIPHGYRTHIRQWMKREGLENLEQAARRLRLSKSALKSIMSNQGKPRYGRSTLERVLKETGC